MPSRDSVISQTSISLLQSRQPRSGEQLQIWFWFSEEAIWTTVRTKCTKGNTLYEMNTKSNSSPQTTSTTWDRTRQRYANGSYLSLNNLCNTFTNKLETRKYPNIAAFFSVSLLASNTQLNNKEKTKKVYYSQKCWRDKYVWRCFLLRARSWTKLWFDG